MKNRIHKFVKYGITSLISTVFDLLFFDIFLNIFEKIKIYPDVFYATIVARILSCILDYHLNSRIVFKVSGNKQKQFIRHAVVMGCQMLLSAVSLTIVDSIFKGNELIEKCIIDTILFFIAYFLQKIWVYKKDSED